MNSVYDSTIRTKSVNLKPLDKRSVVVDGFLEKTSIPFRSTFRTFKFIDDHIVTSTVFYLKSVGYDI